MSCRHTPRCKKSSNTEVPLLNVQSRLGVATFASGTSFAPLRLDLERDLLHPAADGADGISLCSAAPALSFASLASDAASSSSVASLWNGWNSCSSVVRSRTMKPQPTSSACLAGANSPVVLTAPFKSRLHSCCMQRPFVANSTAAAGIAFTQGKSC